MKTEILNIDKQSLNKAKNIILSSGLVAFATETVYGLGANALDESAVGSIFIAKGRPQDNPLIVHIGKKEDIFNIVESLNEKAEKLMDKFMPGPITIILKKKDTIPNNVTAGLSNVAVRMPLHEGARAFINECGVPIAAPSANTSKRPSPTDAQSVLEDMDGKIPLILDGGPCEVGIESTVIDLTREVPTILRPGIITKEEIEKVVGKVDVVLSVKDNEKVASPGVKYTHYAPNCEMVMVENNVVEKTKELYDSYNKQGKKPVILCYEETSVKYKGNNIYILGKDDIEASKNFYTDLRKLEKIYDVIIAEAPKKESVGESLYNRMIKSASHKVY